MCVSWTTRIPMHLSCMIWLIWSHLLLGLYMFSLPKPRMFSEVTHTDTFCVFLGALCFCWQCLVPLGGGCAGWFVACLSSCRRLLMSLFRVHQVLWGAVPRSALCRSGATCAPMTLMSGTTPCGRGCSGAAHCAPLLILATSVHTVECLPSSRAAGASSVVFAGLLLGQPVLI